MSIDMKQFHSVFFDESQEHLSEMEQMLLALDVENPDAEMLNCVFRAAHSIKGGSGIFGFDALTSATHIMEGLLDKIRKGSLGITPSLVDLFLHAVDKLKEILLTYRRGDAVDWAAVNKLTEQLEIATASVAQSTFSAIVQPSDCNHFNKPASILDSNSYGFFDEPVAISVSEPFGFFDDIPVQESKDPIFGFVDSLLTSAPDVPLAATSSSAEKKSNDKKVLIKSKSAESVAVESSSIRVDVAKVDQLINLVGEIVITQSMMNLLGQSLEGNIAEKFQAVSSELERNTREIQEAVMSIRMLPVSFVFNRFPRVVRDLASKLGKQIDLIIEGGETELDKGLTEKLVDPLTHLVRNSIDHGIEASEVRRQCGKNSTGTVILRAAQQGGNIVISISDDGGGLNRERILEKARENNIAVSENPKDEEVWQLIFAPGFSTAAAVTDVSGRGVGMDVVKRNVQSLGGRIDIESRAGQGATFTIHLPLTLAIVDGMCVSVGDQTFIIPLVHIVESMQPAAKDIKILAGDDQLLHVRNEYWPILPLYKVMQLEPQFTDVSKGIAVLIETNKYRFALFVDDLVGQQQVVIKSLEQHYKRVHGVAGATIMGDGSVALIVDVESLALNANSIM